MLLRLFSPHNFKIGLAIMSFCFIGCNSELDERASRMNSVLLQNMTLDELNAKKEKFKFEFGREVTDSETKAKLLDSLNSVCWNRMFTITLKNLEEINLSEDRFTDKLERLSKLEDLYDEYQMTETPPEKHLYQKVKIDELFERRKENYTFEITWSTRLSELKKEIYNWIKSKEDNQLDDCRNIANIIRGASKIEESSFGADVLDSAEIISSEGKKRMFYTVRIKRKFILDCGYVLQELSYFKFRDTMKWEISLDKDNNYFKVEPEVDYDPIKIQDYEYHGWVIDTD